MDDKLRKNRAIQRKYRDNKREKESEKQLQIDQLQAQLAQVQSEREALAQQNAMLQNFARTSVGLLVPQPAGNESAQREGRVLASIAGYFNAVNMYTGKRASAQDIKSTSMQNFFAATEQVSVKQLAELLLDKGTAEGAQKLEVYVLACRKAGLASLQCLTNQYMTKVRGLKWNHAKHDSRLEEILKAVDLSPRQEIELIETCKVFLTTRSQIRRQCQQAVTAIMNCQPVSAPLAAVEEDGGLLEERETMMHAADQFKSSLEQELDSVVEWYRTSMQVLTPAQEARARVTAYPQTLSLWYLADYLERKSLREGKSLQVYHQWKGDETKDIFDSSVVPPLQSCDDYGLKPHDLDSFLKDIAAPI